MFLRSTFRRSRTTDVIVGLGSNMGNRVRQLERGLGFLSDLGNVRAVSGLYETPPKPKFARETVGGSGGSGNSNSLKQSLLN